MKKILLVTSFALSVFLKAQTVPNGDMESINACFSNGFVFSYWNDYGCTDVYVNPTVTANSGTSAMLITNDAALPAPTASQEFYAGPNIPSCLSFFGKIDLNAGDTVRVKVFLNCNGVWFNCGNWEYTDSNAVSVPYTEYTIPLNTAIMCITGGDSLRIELIGGSIMNGNSPTSFYIDDLSFNCTVGIPTVNEAEVISIFPNPAAQQLTIKSGQQISSVKIYSLCGVLLKDWGDLAMNAIALSDLAEGFYFAEIKTAAGTFRRKFEILR
jgi:hypothetical protein